MQKLDIRSANLQPAASLNLHPFYTAIRSSLCSSAEGEPALFPKDEEIGDKKGNIIWKCLGYLQNMPLVCVNQDVKHNKYDLIYHDKYQYQSTWKSPALHKDKCPVKINILHSYINAFIELLKIKRNQMFVQVFQIL